MTLERVQPSKETVGNVYRQANDVYWTIVRNEQNTGCSEYALVRLGDHRGLIHGGHTAPVRMELVGSLRNIAEVLERVYQENSNDL